MLHALLWLMSEAVIRHGARMLRMRGAPTDRVMQREPVKVPEPPALPAKVVGRFGGTPAACRLRLRVWGWTASAYVFAFAWFAFAG